MTGQSATVGHACSHARRSRADDSVRPFAVERAKVACQAERHAAARMMLPAHDAACQTLRSAVRETCECLL